MAKAAKTSHAWGKVWLFGKEGNSSLIISAHGGATDKKFTCPGEGYTAVVYRTSGHGLSTTSMVRDIVDYKNHGGGHGGEANRWQWNPHPTEQTDWSLSKYADSEGTGEDTYADYLAIAENEGIDVVSPRDRFFSEDVRVSTVLKALPNKARYKDIWFSFCLVK